VGSENPIGADNQQGSRSLALSAGGLTPQRLHAELLEADAREIRAYVSGASRDGTFSNRHKTLRISQADLGWLQALQILLERVGSRSWIYREGTRRVWVIETTHRIVHPTTLRTSGERKAFVRGYFDAEGGIPRDPSARFYIQVAQKNRKDLERVHRFLTQLDISSGRVHNPSARVDPAYWRFYVLARSHEDFIKRVSSWHPRKRMLLDLRAETRMKI
jgi:hypothetical protein